MSGNLKECPVCGQISLKVVYDDPSSGGCDSFRCLNCGWC